MHDAIEPGIGAVLARILTHLPAILEIAVPVIPVVEPVLQILVALTRGKHRYYRQKRESREVTADLQAVMWL
jgi:hypothetical protein